MAPPSGEELGWEQHLNNDQFFKVESGNGRVQISNDKIHIKTIEVKHGDAVVIPKGTYHNVISDNNLKLYTIYGPPHHLPNVIHHTHKDELTR